MACSHHDDGTTNVPREKAGGVKNAVRRIVDDTHARLIKGVDVAKGSWHGELKPEPNQTTDHHDHHDHKDEIKSETTHQKHKAHKQNLPHERAANPQKGHWAYKKIGSVGKVGIVTGATIAIGTALHGGTNIGRGTKGYEDKKLGETQPPSATTFLVGAAEVAGGLALLKRALTGRFRF